MFDYLEAGDSLDRFIDHFTDIAQGHAQAVLEKARAALVSKLAEAA